MKTLLLLLFFPIILLASIGKITSVKGEVYIQRETTTISAKVGSILELKDQIITKNNSKVILLFNDNTSITVGKSSTLEVRKYVFDTNTKSNNKATFGFGKGIFRTITGKLGKLNPKGFKIKTSTATIGIRGSDGRIIVTDSGDVKLTTIEGGFVLSIQGKEIFIPKGATGQSQKGALSVFLTTAKFLANNPELVENEAEELKKEEEQTDNPKNKQNSQKEPTNQEPTEKGQTENNIDVNIEEEEIVQIINNFLNDDINEQTNSTQGTNLIDIEALTQVELDNYLTIDTLTLSNDYLTPSNIVQGYIDVQGNSFNYTGTIKGLKNGVTPLTGDMAVTIDYGIASAFGTISNLDVFNSDFAAELTSTGLTNVSINPANGVAGSLTGNLYGNSGSVLAGNLSLTNSSDSFEGQYITKGVEQLP